VQQNLAITKEKGEQRAAAKGTGSAPKKYINVAEGRGDSAELVRLRDAVRHLGLTATIVPGPMLLASTGGRRSARTIMPLSTGSTFTLTKEILDRAYKNINQKQGRLCNVDPDLELDIEAGDRPKWTTHSLRRLANTTAQRYRAVTDAKEAEIDLYFGWNERVLLEKMQIHYAQMSIRERMRLACITGRL